MSLGDVKHWVFDMDGTLTVAVHDFAAIRVALQIPPEDDILTHLAALPADVAESSPPAVPVPPAQPLAMATPLAPSSVRCRAVASMTQGALPA